ncbi:Hypothetical protein SRAE_2000381000 [Strongyloides ratti]|uniref:Uncharacterized protein n=1 Tax=Strongyloides ratti TaxID=34506 RepID=A0A090MZL8_STRRB|nr:Hypothetical protein SRAE_2000381000 [Strongyloides ratti]CEF69159.1 Hypothetical protein SRAE_2000381000 [Strongyloides ratti]
MKFLKILILLSTLVLPTVTISYNIQGYLLRKKLHEINKSGQSLFDNSSFKKLSKIRVISPVKPRKQSRNCFFSVIQCYLPKVDVYKSSDNKIYGKLRNGKTYHGSI